MVTHKPAGMGERVTAPYPLKVANNARLIAVRGCRVVEAGTLHSHHTNSCRTCSGRIGAFHQQRKLLSIRRAYTNLFVEVFPRSWHLQGCDRRLRVKCCSAARLRRDVCCRVLSAAALVAESRPHNVRGILRDTCVLYVQAPVRKTTDTTCCA